ncbi:MAG: TonB-dependent receptor [Deltaproteobacteria bacterium]|nr:TonB-dependent receptor [Deltaproteobacteria bacterium]
MPLAIQLGGGRVVGAWIAALGAVARAEAAPVDTATTSAILPVEVRARRSSVPDPTATRESFGREAIGRALDRGRELSELLDTASGVRVLDVGGGARRASVRAGSPSQMLLVVDGVPIRSPFSTGPDLELVDLGSMERVEVVRGGAGAALGDGALTGSVLIDARRRATPKLSLGYGSLDTVSMRGSVPTPIGSVWGSYRRSNGEFAYVSRIEGLPDRAEVRENNDTENASASFATEPRLGETRLPIALHAGLRRAGVAGLETQESLTAREERALAFARIGARSRSIVASLSSSVQRFDYEESTHRSSLDFLRADAFFDAHATEAIALRAELSAEDVVATRFDAATRIATALAGSAKLDLGPVRTFGAIRAYLANDDAGLDLEILPRIGASYGDNWIVTAGFGRSLRVPTLDERFHPRDQGLEGSRSLLPESSWEAELSLESPTKGEPIAVSEANLPAGRIHSDRAPRVHLELSAFGRLVEHTIVYEARDAFVIRPVNLAPARVVGVELSFDARVELSEELHGFARGNAALTLSELEDTKEPLPGQPFLAGDLEAGVARSWAELSLRTDAASPANANPRGTVEIPAYGRLDATLLLRPDPSYSAAFTVANVLDVETIQTVFKIPTPGRTFWVVVRAEGL